MNTETRSTKLPVQQVPVTLQGQSRGKRLFPGLLAGLGFAAFFLVAVPALAADAPSLGTAESFLMIKRVLQRRLKLMPWLRTLIWQGSHPIPI